LAINPHHDDLLACVLDDAALRCRWSWSVLVTAFLLLLALCAALFMLPTDR
jgi:hypothetical protein